MASKTATTNAQGKATLEGVEAGELSITITKEGYQTVTETITVGENATAFTKKLTAESSGASEPTIADDPEGGKE